MSVQVSVDASLVKKFGLPLEPEVAWEIIVVGINHKVAPVEARERLAFSPGEIPAALRWLTDRLPEAALLSTCNRLEVYAASSNNAQAEAIIRDFLGQARPGLPAGLLDQLYVHAQAAAVRHLFAVAAGLDSMLLGEPQILGQVNAALESAQGFVGPVLSRLFQRAISVGKAARTQTGISRQALSVGYAAVELAKSAFVGSKPRRVLIVGAGKMAEAVARTLSANDLGSILVTNRTYERAAHLAQELGAAAIRFDRLAEALAMADIVISSSAAPHLVIRLPMVEEAMSRRDWRPLVFIDIAVPRDVDPAVVTLEGVRLYDIDDLQGVCDAALRHRQREADKVSQMVALEASDFMRWLASLRGVPTIRALCRQAEVIHQAEVAKALKKMGPLSEGQCQAVDALSKAIVKKILHGPITRLKEPLDLTVV